MMTRALPLILAVLATATAAGAAGAQTQAAARVATLPPAGVTPATATNAPSPEAAVDGRRTLMVTAPGGSGVIAARVPVPAMAVSWTVRPADGVRVLGAMTGSLSSDDAAADGVLSVTFSLPRNHPAGPARLGAVQLRTGRGEEIIELVTTVPARRALEISVVLADSVRPGAVVNGHMRVRNAGTALDTVVVQLEVDRGWRVENGPDVLVLAQGAEQQIPIRVRVPADAQNFTTAELRATAAGVGTRTTARAPLAVTPGAGRGAVPYRQLPVTVFAGLSAADAGALRVARSSFGLAAHGEIADGTRLEVLAQDDEIGTGMARPHGMRSHTLLRARVRTDHWSAALGDGSTAAGMLPRLHAAGRGVEAGIRAGRLDGHAAVLFPRVGWGLDPHEGIINAGAGATTSAGRLGVSLLQARRSATDGTGTGTGRSAALQYQLLTGTHSIAAEAGWMESQTALHGRQGGAAAEASYRYTGPTASLSALVRRAPETALLGGGVRAENSLHGAVLLGRTLVASAGVHSYEATAADFAFFNELGEERVRVGPSAAGGSLSLGWRHGVNTLGASGQLLRRESPGASDLRRTVTLQGGRAFGRLGVNLAGEAGERTSLHGAASAQDGTPAHGAALPVQRVRGSLSWASSAGSLWASVEHSNEGPPLAVALNASLRLRALEVTTSMNTFRDSLSLPATTFSTFAVLAVTSSTAVRAGAEYRPWAQHQTSPWAVSIGVRRALSMPVPGSARRDVVGVLYDDVNGNGRRDPGEPGLPNVLLQMGTAATTTDVHGGFQFRAAAAGVIVASQRTLPAGMMVRDAAAPRDAGALEIAVVRTADLTVRVSIDDGAGNSRAAGAGLLIRLSNDVGHTRTALTDSTGVARFPDLLPGTAAVIVEPPAVRPGETAVDPVSARVTLLPGAPTEALLSMTQRTRPVRYFNKYN
jgi:hypothetical protein